MTEAQKDNRKEWLAQKINELVDKSLMGELSEADKVFLDCYTEEYNIYDIRDRRIADARSKAKSKEMRNRRGRGRYGERRLAEKVGGIVVGRSKFIITPNGTGIKIDCQRPPDVVTSMFALESKYRSHIPVSIKKIMTQAVINAPDGLIPVGVLADREERSVYYILMEKDWLLLHGKEEK